MSVSHFFQHLWAQKQAFPFEYKKHKDRFGSNFTQRPEQNPKTNTKIPLYTKSKGVVQEMGSASEENYLLSFVL